MQRMALKATVLSIHISTVRAIKINTAITLLQAVSRCFPCTLEATSQYARRVVINGVLRGLSGTGDAQFGGNGNAQSEPSHASFPHYRNSPLRSKRKHFQHGV